MKLREWINIFIILLLLGFAYYRYQNRTFSESRTLLLLDTQIDIFVLSKSNNVNSLIEEAFQMIEKYDLLFSYHNSKSFLYRINQSSYYRDKVESLLPFEEKTPNSILSDSLLPIENIQFTEENNGIWFSICEDFYEILKLSELIYYKSNHLYDVSIARLYDIWDFDNKLIPSLETIEIAQSYIGFVDIEFDQNSLFLPHGYKLNFGSLAKGFIVDRVMDMLAENNVSEAFINAGGDIRFFSHDSRRWRVGIRHPRDVFSNIAILSIPDMAVATSGDYERYFILDGVRYHHILNPSTGFPSTPTVSVTVFSQTAFIADALSTAAMVMNPFDAVEMIKLFDETEAIIFFYDENGEPVSLNTENIRRWIR